MTVTRKNLVDELRRASCDVLNEFGKVNLFPDGPAMRAYHRLANALEQCDYSMEEIDYDVQAETGEDTSVSLTFHPSDADENGVIHPRAVTYRERDSDE